MKTTGHMPVLAGEVVRLIAPHPSGTYVDATVGAGGHAREILEASAPSGELLGIDRDPEALGAAAETLAPYGERVTLRHGRLAELPEVLARAGRPQVDGIVVDLGLSSMQVDDPERGFSFSRPGPIDMRMDPSSGPTALDLIRTSSVRDVEIILRDFGEERFARAIAQRLGDAARRGELETTADLAEVVKEAIPAKAQKRESIHPATRTFQALRIATNRELAEIDAFLEAFPDLLAPGGRMVAISFHSLEDRRVKRRLRDLAWSSSLPPEYAEAAGERVHPICRRLTGKPIAPANAEIRQNPRARSAKLRACEKL